MTTPNARQSFAIAWLLARRELLAEYRQSRLSLLWPVLHPLLYTILFVLMRPVFGVEAAREIPWRFGLFAFVGMLAWQVWHEVLRGQMDALRRHRALVSRGELDAGALFLATTLQALVHATPGVLLAAVVGVVGLGADALAVASLAVFALVVVLNGAAIGALLQPFATLSTDVGRVIQSISLALMVTAAVFLPLPEDPSTLLKTMIAANPLGALLNAARAPLLGDDWLVPAATLAWTAATLAAALLAPRMNRRVLPVLVERMGG